MNCRDDDQFHPHSFPSQPTRHNHRTGFRARGSDAPSPAGPGVGVQELATPSRGRLCEPRAVVLLVVGCP
jgi:hypothetical protein